MKKSHDRGRHEVGQSLVEFALAVPIIILLIFGVVDLGRGIFVYNTLAESARQANRMAIVDQRESEIAAVAIAHAPTLGLSATDIDACYKAHDAPPASRTCATSTDACSTLAIGCLAIVTSSTNFQPITPIIGALVPPISMSSTSIGPIEYVCPNASRTTCP